MNKKRHNGKKSLRPNVCMPTQRLCGHTRAHARTLMRYFLTFLHVPLENIDESPFKNNSCLVGSLSDLQFYCQHIIITFIMSDCAGACMLWWEVAPAESDHRQNMDFHEKHSLSLSCTENSKRINKIHTKILCIK